MLKITTLGGFSVYLDDQHFKLPPQQEALLIYLVSAPPIDHTRSGLTLLFWKDKGLSRKQLTANWSNLWYEFRQSEVGKYLTNAGALTEEREAFDIDLEKIEHKIDLVALEAVLKVLDSGQVENRRQALMQAAELYTGDFLDGVDVKAPGFTSWMTKKRGELHRSIIDKLQELIRLHLEEDNLSDKAIEYLEQWVRLEFDNEDALRELMVQLAKHGQAGTAKIYYDGLENYLRSLSPERSPDSATTQLMEEINRGKYSAPALPQPIPRETDSFVDRDEELEIITGHLANPNCRIIALVGPGGFGKTHLALKAARQTTEFSNENKIFVALAPLSSPQQIVFAIFKALGRRSLGIGEPKRELLAFLGPQKMLLVMDNVEHLLAGDAASECITLFNEIVDNSPDSKILATSQRALNMGEWQIPVGGLQPQSAIELFLQARRRLQPLARSEPINVARICELVDRMPLGIEITAALHEVNLQKIVSGIEGSFDHLKSSRRDIPERHRTMQAVFEYSWDLLSPQAQKVLAMISVFPTEFSAEDAEQVTGITAIEDYLTELVYNSMLKASPSGYELHPHIRTYAAEKLNVPDPDFDIRSLYVRAADYFKGKSKPGSEWESSVDSELPKAEFKYRLLLEEYDAAAWILLKVAQTLAHWGQFELFFDMYQQVFDKITDPRLRYMLLNNCGLMKVQMGVVMDAMLTFENVRDFAITDSRSIHWQLSALINRGNANLKLGQFSQAIQLFEEIMGLPEPGFAAQRLLTTELWAEAQFGLGQYREALQRYLHVITHSRDIPDQAERMDILRVAAWDALSKVLIVTNDAADEALSEAITWATIRNLWPSLKSARINRAILMLHRGNLSEARREIDYARSITIPQDECLAATVDGLIAVGEGKRERAETACRKAVELARELLKKTRQLCDENYLLALARAVLLALDKGTVAEAEASYHRAIGNCRASGIVAWNGRLLDALIRFSDNEKLRMIRAILPTK